MTYKWKPYWKYEKIDESRCRASVHEDRCGSHQCCFKAKYDGKWCGIHRPEAAEAREAKRGPTKFEQKVAAQIAHAEYVKGLEEKIKRMEEVLCRFCECQINHGEGCHCQNDE